MRPDQQDAALADLAARTQALELLGSFRLMVSEVKAACRARHVPYRSVANTPALTLTAPTRVVLGVRGRVVRSLGRGHALEVEFTIAQVEAMADYLESLVPDELAPIPQAVLEQRARAELEKLTQPELDALHRRTFPEEYADGR